MIVLLVFIAVILLVLLYLGLKIYLLFKIICEGIDSNENLWKKYIVDKIRDILIERGVIEEDEIKDVS